jgi:epsilon-lactone hydrolase
MSSRLAIGVRVPPAVVRLGARQLGRRVLNPDLPWEVQRQRLDRLMAGSPVPRGTMITSNALNGVRTEVVTAAGVAPGRTVVHFHGGGYCVGSARIARTWAAHLSAQAACRVVLPEYRLAPENAHPAALDDARDVMKALVSDVAPASIVLSGD